jgi:2,3-bisphosphoglycerate-independent phosphoglycerate mutase
VKVCLVILDGWGLAPPGPGNAVDLANTPVFDRLWAEHPHTQLDASGRSVGLPDGQMGNSEVGHLNLGAGAIVRQDLTRLDDAIADGSFARNDALLRACGVARDRGRLHLMGLVSAGGVHASLDHLRALIELAGAQDVPDTIVHAFTDGRDTNPDSGAGYVAEVESWGGARIATVGGRYYAMDRDHRWERTERAYNAIVEGQADHCAPTGEAAVRAAYERGETDEFIVPTLVGDEGRVREGDAVIFFNFRPDRARQLCEKLGPLVDLTTLTEYHEDWTYPVAFPPERPQVTLASFLAERGIEQLHVAETEKYAHVTYFFNGGEENPYPGEERSLVDSPRDVPTYDYKPEMSAREAAASFVERWTGRDYGFGIINFANADMVGHTGSIPAAVAACEVVDECLGQVAAAVEGSGGACIVTADHGNADNMLEPDGSPNTAHSLNPVPLIVTSDVGALRSGGVLADVAPTVLGLMGLSPPAEMGGKSLLQS